MCCNMQALCWCSRPLDDAGVAALMGVQKRAVAQDTPVRVLHRRASKVCVGVCA
jgi:tRNA U54 and U55 pseudouridine synthase Pus10